jgi:hypothetical protein
MMCDEKEPEALKCHSQVSKYESKEEAKSAAIGSGGTNVEVETYPMDGLPVPSAKLPHPRQK